MILDGCVHTIESKQLHSDIPFPLWCPRDVVSWSLGVMGSVSRQSRAGCVERSRGNALGCKADPECRSHDAIEWWERWMRLALLTPVTPGECCCRVIE